MLLVHCIHIVVTYCADGGGLLLICLPLQVILISFLRDLSINLGGSCCGYALVTPSVLRRFVGYSTLDVLSEDVIFCYIYK